MSHCQGQSTTPSSVTPRYSTLLQNLAAASRARSALEAQLKTSRQTFETLRQNEQNATGMKFHLELDYHAGKENGDDVI